LLCFLLQVKILEIYLFTIPRIYEKSDNCPKCNTAKKGKFKVLQQQQISNFWFEISENTHFV
jgi:hypothetical protein